MGRVLESGRSAYSPQNAAPKPAAAPAAPAAPPAAPYVPLNPSLFRLNLKGYAPHLIPPVIRYRP